MDTKRGEKMNPEEIKLEIFVKKDFITDIDKEKYEALSIILNIVTRIGSGFITPHIDYTLFQGRFPPTDFIYTEIVPFLEELYNKINKNDTYNILSLEAIIPKINENIMLLCRQAQEAFFNDECPVEEFTKKVVL